MKRISASVLVFFALFTVSIAGGCVSSVQTPTMQPSVVAVVATATSLPTSMPLPTATPTQTSTPTTTPTPTQTPTITPTPLHPVGRVIFHEADDSNPYYWFSYVPRSISKDTPVYILLTGFRAEDYDTYENLVEVARGEIQRRTDLAEQHRYILLVPHIPRQGSPHIYTAAFDRQVFYDSTDPFYQRPDLKINLMVDTLVSQLRIDGYNIQEQIFIEGFSVGGMFTQRYTLLHPERVRAIAAGQCGGVLTLPETYYEDTALVWPIGINDFEELIGNKFSQDDYQLVPQLIYIGDNDLGPTNSTQIDYGGGNSVLWDMGWSHETAKAWIVFLDNTFGDTDPDKLENQVEYMNSSGYDQIIFKMYGGVGHQYTDDMIRDTLSFFDTYR